MGILPYRWTGGYPLAHAAPWLSQQQQQPEQQQQQQQQECRNSSLQQRQSYCQYEALENGRQQQFIRDHGLVHGLGRLISMMTSDIGENDDVEYHHNDVSSREVRNESSLRNFVCNCKQEMHQQWLHKHGKSSSLNLNDDDLIQNLCYNGQLDDAIDLLFRVATIPHVNTYLSILKLCNKRKCLNQTDKVRAHIIENRMEIDGLVGDHLVVSLANCGALKSACELHDKLPQRTVFSWTAIISAYTENGCGQRALKTYECMQEDGVQPSSYTFVVLFKACGSIADLAKGMQFHTEAHKRGFTSIVFVCNSLLSMYGKCEAVAEAEDLFGGMLQRDVVTWNALLSAYVEQNRGEEGLLLFRQMQQENVCPDQHTFVFALQACGTLVSQELCNSPTLEGHSMHVIALGIGQALHADAKKGNLSSDVFVGTALSMMYGKFGDDTEVENVFSTLHCRDIVAWNAMLSSYIEQGKGEKTLSLYRQMQVEGTSPNELTFVIALKACCTIAEKQGHCEAMALEVGQALHTDAQRNEFASGSFFGTSLLSMYGKCGSLMEAEYLFNTLFELDVVSWNVLISTYVQQGQGEKALLLYRQMQEEDVCMDNHTVVSALQACSLLAEKEEGLLVDGCSIKALPLEIGHALHAIAHKKGITRDIFVSNTLVSMYGKCGTIGTAEDCFGAVSQHDVVSWNSLLSAYILLGFSVKALQLYRQMLEEDVCPDHLTYVILLQACGILAEKEEPVISNGRPIKWISLKIGRALHEDVCRAGHASELQINNTLVSVYGKCGVIYEAEHVFHNSSPHGVVSWTALLSAYTEQGQGERALQVFGQMQEEGTTPNTLTYVIALQACGILAEKEEALCVKGKLVKLLSLEIGVALHSEVAMKGNDAEVLVGTLLVSMYGKCGAIMEAEHVFFELIHVDVNSLNAMLSIYVAEGEGEKALQLHAEMKHKACILDDITCISVLQACSDTGSLEVCNEMHFLLASAEYDRIKSMVATLIHTYGSCGSMIDAEALLNGLPYLDLVSLTACISSHAGGGSLTASDHVLEKVRLLGMKPDGVIFTSVLSACSHLGLIVEGLEYFYSMIQDYGMTPTLRHYSTVVDLLGRAGDFKKLANIMEKMPMQDDLSFWLCLLGACRLHSHLELAEQAFRQATKLHPKGVAAYILISNIYADAEFHVHAHDVQGEWD